MTEDVSPLLAPQHDPHFPTSAAASTYAEDRHAPHGQRGSMDRQQAATEVGIPGRSFRPRSEPVTGLVVFSYIADWLVLAAVSVISWFIGNLNPNKRPFSLENPDISFPYTEHETVTSTTLILCNTLAPAALIFLVSLFLVPGRTVPVGTPRSLIFRRKLWELHSGWLGLGVSLATAWFVTNGMKNLCGKPRPDLMARCDADLANLAQYVVGGLANSSSNGQLVSGDICKNTDDSTLQDGFRSFPSGHSSSAAAGLIYLSLFLASKFAVTIPFLAPLGHATEAAFSAFPSRARAVGAGPVEVYELVDRKGNGYAGPGAAESRLAPHFASVASVRRQAAAPPLYLLVLALLPFFGAVFIAMSRWFDFRHHGFDILFGFFIGTVTAVYSFRYYHLPIQQGAGWAWGPRSHDKALWAGVGSFSYATGRYRPEYDRTGDEEAARAANDGLGAAARRVSNRAESDAVNGGE